MNIVYKLVLVNLMLFTNSSWAQASNFDGFSAVISSKFPTGTFSTYSGKISTNDSTQDLRLQYTLQFKNNLTLGASFETGLSNQKVGSFLRDDWTLRDRSAIGLIPGFVFDQNNMLFGKISIINVKLNTGSSFNSESKRNGVGYGIGIRHQFTNNIFVQVAYEEEQYDQFIIDTTVNVAPGITQFTRSTISPLTSGGMSFGIGYQF